MSSAKIGRWAFLAGLAVAVIVGFTGGNWGTWLLLVLGLVVGFLNITGSESHNFLLAAVALTITAASLGGLPLVGGLVSNVLSASVVFISAATVVVAVKSLFETAQN